MRTIKQKDMDKFLNHVLNAYFYIHNGKFDSKYDLLGESYNISHTFDGGNPQPLIKVNTRFNNLMGYFLTDYNMDNIVTIHPYFGNDENNININEYFSKLKTALSKENNLRIIDNSINFIRYSAEIRTSVNISKVIDFAKNEEKILKDHTNEGYDHKILIKYLDCDINKGVFSKDDIPEKYTGELSSIVIAKDLVRCYGNKKQDAMNYELR